MNCCRDGASSSYIEKLDVNSRTKRRIVYHLAACGVGAACSAVIYILFSKREIVGRLSIATAYGALGLCAVALLVGPWRTLRSQPNPVSYDLRRDFGIWAGIFALLHTAIGLNVHLRGRMWLYFVDEHGRWRTSAFGFGNYTGTLAALLFIWLLAISNDASLRRLGAVRWKSWQRWTYVAVALTFAHGLLYQHLEKRALLYHVVYIAIIAAVTVVQVAGVWHRQRTLRN